MIGAPELIAVVIAALFLFGPQKLPELARSLGGAVGEFKKAQRAAELELTDFDAYTQKEKKTAVTQDKGKNKEESKASLKEGEKNESTLKENEDEIIRKLNESYSKEKKEKTNPGSALEAQKSIPDAEELEDYLKSKKDSK